MGKRIAAWAGIILLVGLYAATLILALTGSEGSAKLLMFSVVMTVIIPIFFYIYIKIYEMLKERKPFGKEDDLITFDNRARMPDFSAATGTEPEDDLSGEERQKVRL